MVKCQWISSAHTPYSQGGSACATVTSTPSPTEASPDITSPMHSKATHTQCKGPPPEGTLGYCTWAQEAINTKAQKENGLGSGLQDQRSFSDTRVRHEDAGGQATDTHRNVMGHCRTVTTGPVCQLRTQLTSVREHRPPSPPPPPPQCT